MKKSCEQFHLRSLMPYESSTGSLEDHFYLSFGLSQMFNIKYYFVKFPVVNFNAY